jgi:hypothetical protein
MHSDPLSVNGSQVKPGGDGASGDRHIRASLQRIDAIDKPKNATTMAIPFINSAPRTTSEAAPFMRFSALGCSTSATESIVSDCALTNTNSLGTALFKAPPPTVTVPDSTCPDVALAGIAHRRYLRASALYILTADEARSTFCTSVHRYRSGCHCIRSAQG